MKQSRLESMAETAINTAIGYVIAIGSQLVIFPVFGIAVSLSENLWIGAWFTVISLARGYAVRRWFNGRIKRAAERMVVWGDESEAPDERY